MFISLLIRRTPCTYLLRSTSMLSMCSTLSRRRGYDRRILHGRSVRGVHIVDPPFVASVSSRGWNIHDCERGFITEGQ